MKDRTVISMPTQDQLTRAQGSHFTLWVGDGQALNVELLEVVPGVAMSSRHECFSVCFGLPLGIALPQDSYRVGPPDEEGWLLLMTPCRPESDGRHLLQAVFHMEKPA